MNRVYDAHSIDYGGTFDGLMPAKRAERFGEERFVKLPLLLGGSESVWAMPGFSR